MEVDTAVEKLDHQLRALALANNELKRKPKHERAARKQAEARLEELEASEDVAEREHRKLEHAKLTRKLKRRAEGPEIQEVENQDLHKELEARDEELKSQDHVIKCSEYELGCAQRDVQREKWCLRIE